MHMVQVGRTGEKVQFLVLLILNMLGLASGKSERMARVKVAFLVRCKQKVSTNTHTHASISYHRYKGAFYFTPISFESIASLHELIGTFFRLAVMWKKCERNFEFFAAICNFLIVWLKRAAQHTSGSSDFSSTLPFKRIAAASVVCVVSEKGNEKCAVITNRFFFFFHPKFATFFHPQIGPSRIAMNVHVHFTVIMRLVCCYFHHRGLFLQHLTQLKLQAQLLALFIAISTHTSAKPRKNTRSGMRRVSENEEKCDGK